MKNQRANVDQVIQAHLLLGEVVKKLENGRCEYLHGATDRTIAAKIGCSPHTVAHVRRTMFGNLASNVRTQTLRDEVEELKIRVGKLEHRLV